MNSELQNSASLKLKIVGPMLFVLFVLASSSTLVPGTARASDLDSPLQVAASTQSSISNAVTSLTQAKEITNPIFWNISQQLVNAIVKSTVNWINSGFHGSPAFVTNLQSSLLQAGDTQAQSFINQFLSNGSVKSPFSESVGQNALNSYLLNSSSGGFFTKNTFTLGQSSPNPTALLNGSITQGGGLPAWLSTALGPGNNPISAQATLQNELNGRVASSQGSLLTQLGWGSGFKSFQGNCPASSGITTTSSGSTVTTSNGVTVTGSGSVDLSGEIATQAVTTAAPSVSLTNTDPCAGQPIKTPGTAIMAELNKSLGTGIDSLLNAKEFDELVNALLSQLLNQVLGPSGLSGVSQPSSSGQSFLNSAATTTPNLSAGVSVANDMQQIVLSQTTELQQFVTNWQTILGAATAAKTALTSSTCMSNAQTLITTTVQPVIDQAALEISNAGASVSSLQQIESEIPTGQNTGVAVVAPQLLSTENDVTLANNQISSEINSALGQVTNTEDSTLQSAQASADYSAFLAATSTPNISDITYAATQAEDTGTSTPSSLLTQMNQLTVEAQCSP